tara:strand:- start:394 stop:672 length:279 start_codon:yes stop_codon:yes gene_type:complete
MAKKDKKEFKLLTDEQENQLQKMVNDMLEVAADVVEEYDDLDLSEIQALSGSITQIHEDSPFLDGIFKGKSWKRVVKNLPKEPKQPKDKDAS